MDVHEDFWGDSGSSPPKSKIVTIYDYVIIEPFLSKILTKAMNSVKTSPTKLFDKRIWTIKDVAEYLGCSVKTIYNKTSRSEIPHFKKGKVLYFRPEDIENWVMEGNL